MISHRTLEECLTLYSDEILEYIMEDKDIEKNGNMTHKTMCRQIAAHMMQPEELELYFSCLSDDEVSRLKEGITRDFAQGTREGSYQIPMLLCQAEYAFRLSDEPEDAELFWLPYDVAEAFVNMQSEAFTIKRKKQNHFLSCLMAVDTFYGAVPMHVIAPVMQKSVEEAAEGISGLPRELSHYIAADEMIYHRDLYLEDYGILNEQKEIPYYIPDKEELDELARWGYLPTRAEMRALVNYLISEKNMDTDVAEYVSMWIQKMTAAGGSPEDVYNYLEEFGVLTKGERALELNELIQVFQRNTRKLINRGFTDMELLMNDWQQD